MMQQQLQRPITSGSRQAPDPYDQFLESRCLYRKHTARDASSLFRVIAEQMYDTQMLNYEVRLECVRFMTKKRRIFEQDVIGDFDSYLQEMSKPKTYGTMLELRAMCCMYRRNVILFEPFNMGTVVTFNSRYQDDFRVFYTNENHFDSVYPLDYVQMGAICQSITYKLLYVMLFKLPDVSYAVERMLHPHTLEWGTCDVEVDNRGYILRIRCYDGRIFQLDLPDLTKCILENYKLCSFHNTVQRGNASHGAASTTKFDTSDILLQSPTGQNDDSDMGQQQPQMCPNRIVSCVRQLLDDGITPFPYKVAKSLDPFMYRNVEFDCWNDLRKEAKRYNAYAGDYDFKVGAKCRVEMEHDSELYTCHIQSISQDKTFCVVYVEEYGKKLVVPYDSVHPLPPDEFRPWTLPHRCQRQMQRMHLSKFISKSNKMHKWKKNKMFDMGNYFEATKCDIVQMHQYIQLDHCYHNMNEQQQQQQQQQQLREETGEPVVAAQEQERERDREPSSSSQQRHQRQGVIATCAPANQESKAPASVIPVPAIHTHAHFMNYLPMQPGSVNNAISPDGQVAPAWATSSPLVIHEEFQYPVTPVIPPPPPPTGGAPVTTDSNCVFMPFGAAYGPPPALPTLSLQPQPLPLSLPPPPPFFPLPPPPASSNSQSPVEPRRSLHFNGGDLPADVSTLRYFYNMGVDMHLRMAQQLTPLEEMPAFAYNNSSNNTDQPQQQQQHQIPSDEKVNPSIPSTTTTTPPPSPDANNSGTMEPSIPIVAERTNHRPKHRNNATNSHHNNKSRGKRQEQLKDLSDNHQLAHNTVTAFMPTPTPSPNTNGKQFNFYGSPSAGPPLMATYVTPQLMQPSPQSVGGPPGSGAAVPFFFHKGGPPGTNGQPHFGWGIAAPPPPQLYENLNNHPVQETNNNGNAAAIVLSTGPAPVPAYGGSPRHH